MSFIGAGRTEIMPPVSDEHKIESIDKLMTY